MKGSAEPVAVAHSNDCDRCCAIIPSLQAITLASPACSPQLFFFLYVTCEENSTCRHRPRAQTAFCRSSDFKGLKRDPRLTAICPHARCKLSVCFVLTRGLLFLSCFHATWSSVSVVSTSWWPLKLWEKVIYLSGLWCFNCFYSHDAFNRRGSQSNTDVGSWSRRTITRWWPCLISGENVGKVRQSFRHPFSRLLIILIELSWTGSPEVLPEMSHTNTISIWLQSQHASLPWWFWLCCPCCRTIPWGPAEPYTPPHPDTGASDTTISAGRWTLREEKERVRHTNRDRHRDEGKNKSQCVRFRKEIIISAIYTPSYASATSVLHHQKEKYPAGKFK